MYPNLLEVTRVLMTHADRLIDALARIDVLERAAAAAAAAAAAGPEPPGC